MRSPHGFLKSKWFLLGNRCALCSCLFYGIYNIFPSVSVSVTCFLSSSTCKIMSSSLSLQRPCIQQEQNKCLLNESVFVGQNLSQLLHSQESYGKKWRDCYFNTPKVLFLKSKVLYQCSLMCSFLF